MAYTTSSTKKIGRPSVFVIGAGMAGVSAARKLVDSGYFGVTVLEAHPTRYGGRLYSFKVPGNGGKMVDFGAMWIHGGSGPNHPISQLCRRYAIDTIDFHILNQENLLLFDEHGRPFSEEKFERAVKAMFGLNEVVENARKRLAESKQPDISVRTLLDNIRNWDDDFPVDDSVKDIAVPALESIQAAMVYDLSVTFMEGVPGSPEHVEFPGEDLVIPSGYKTLLDKMAMVGQKFPILLDRRVERVRINENSALVELVASDHENNRYHYTANRVILAVPVGVLKSRSIHFEPSLPSEQMGAIDRMGFGVKTKVLLVYDQVFWPNSKVFYAESKHWPTFFMNLYRLNGIKGLLVTLDAKESSWAETMTDQTIIEQVLQRLAVIVGEEKMQRSRLVYSKIVRWSNERFVKGAYSFGKIGMTVKDAYAIRQPISPYIFFAGEHTQWPEGEAGTVLAAYMSGERVAGEILNVHGYDDHKTRRPIAKL